MVSSSYKSIHQSMYVPYIELEVIDCSSPFSIDENFIKPFDQAYNNTQTLQTIYDTKDMVKSSDDTSCPITSAKLMILGC